MSLHNELFHGFEKNATFRSINGEKNATFRSINGEKNATFRQSAENLEHNREQDECSQNASKAGGEEDHESVKDSVFEPALE